MDGGNAAVAQAALFQIWESFIGEKYMKEAGQNDAARCPTCNSPRTCKNYFCLECKTGGLCPAVFRGDNQHRHHPWLQVRQYSQKDSVLSTSLEHFMSKDWLKHIHTNKLHGNERHCYLKSKQVAGPCLSSRRTLARPGGEKICEGCMGSIRGSKLSTETFLVCSLQCLLKVACNRPALNLLAMNDGAMDPVQPPLFYTEKIKESRLRRLKTLSKTPVVEAPSSPQATGDSPMLRFLEILREEPVVEAPPLPPAIGDFPISETHEDLEVESILAALPCPLEIDDYPMFGTPTDASFCEVFLFPPALEDFQVFGTPADASFGEALLFPPATEDFPMFGTPADASFGEAFLFPPALEDFQVLGTPADTSFGEALLFPPATEDFPMFGTPVEASFGEDLPFPPATGDSPMFETHEYLEGEAILADLPFPLEIDNCPMFGTPTEASFGEVLPFPPATEEFSMFGTTAEASFGEAFSVAPATEGSPMSENPEAPPAAPADRIQLRRLLFHLNFKPLTSAPSGQRRCG